ncbi:low molecular weight phosphatase family protein [Thalassospira marina]|uniref:Low molecular weight phosphatase family protein n=1 Tax=Thalassospira marina TaxID=2048283 RepID=A0A2N3KRU4_9PROT|nr:low molecular weight phosphatase family protein [Thalassospira marina]AUG53705.1 low molecular weight phosphatase family protein [Thalassospira marina]PKR53240.1 low molecular weight phosphatase family protein [Thalassospira marina]
MAQDIPGAVLFACSYNAVRSIMAATLMRHFHGNRVYVECCGLRAGDLDGFAVAVMDEIGLDISGYKPKTFDELEDGFFDLIVTLSPEAQHRAVEMTRTMACDVEFWNTFDATLIEGTRETRLEAYRQVRDQLKKRILERFPLAPAPTF